MSLVLQISDTHFGTERPPVVEALVALASQLRPDVVVLSGDITQRARRAQFDAARRLVERLPPAPLLALPGNHDIPLCNLAARIFDSPADLLLLLRGEQLALPDGLQIEADEVKVLTRHPRLKPLLLRT